MCGRYFFQLQQSLPLISNHEQLALFNFSQGEIFPTQNTLVITETQGDARAQVMKWGMRGYQGKLLINARSESIHERRTFRSLLKQRCLIIANGFYEWQKRGTVKDKIFVQKANQTYILLAGLYNNQGEYVIVTGESRGAMAHIHHRTPIIMNDEAGLSYLREESSFAVDNENLVFQRS